MEPILAGNNCLLLAPTAGGKTEAAILPVLSAMLSRGWDGLSVLYLCPLRALLNNLEERLSFYGSLVGRQCGLWHGDVSQALKARMLSDPPDILLTTPESLEAILISRRTDKGFFFGSLQAVVVDEIHAFAGDDRGWHLLCVLERIKKLAGRDFQRIGLSATVGNPERLSSWLSSASDRDAQVIASGAGSPTDADVTIDYVGELDNAVRVLRQLHRGEKRLVFCDSRARCEELATLLRAADVRVFVSHSSLSAEQRREAEAAFRDARDCIIVATSTLELGIDVGDLDRVVQIDSPATVSSFLQRLGRTGRRPGSNRNFLFLTTSDGSLLQAAAIVELWREGFVEPLVPPALPFHVVAQQIMALSLQQSGITRSGIADWLARTFHFMDVGTDTVGAIVGHMLREAILDEDSNVLGIGPTGERLYGSRNFIDLMSVFDTPPLLDVYWGPRDLGSVHPISLLRRNDEGIVILALGGRSWQVTQIDRERNVVNVVPAEHGGRSRWLGESAPLSFTLCQAIRRILLGAEPSSQWSKRATQRITELQRDCTWVSPDGLVLEKQAVAGFAWWTFAGLAGNHTVAHRMKLGFRSIDNFAIRVEDPKGIRDWLDGVREPQQPASDNLDPSVSRKIKFSQTLDRNTMGMMQAVRNADPEAKAFVEKQRLVHCFRSPNQ